ncbi:LPS export ABC transporter periplasmic protein LptC [Thalassotalea sp. HSM 43]|uniref:LPS export ABC transporter periplasmic protein LptC n=1 Tax=Thalassotalea sp. HSM 43 TaxID=2552945 RepID=UPI001081842B|nr:LPS export ABC transporter periplasmic protein LptC [Thalassotalea sp. HSM 43]QBY04780.1 LPS export ABC transporter periplasmic protein LptC [Thalassotalea sp. HSM 43]
MSRLHLISILLFILALASYGYLHYQQSQQADVEVIKPLDEPAFVANALSSKKFDSDGHLVHTIYAEQMTHFDQLGETKLLKPAYTLYPDDGSEPWRLTAESGFLGKDNILILKDRVRLICEDKNAFISEVQGEELALDLDTKIITSDQNILLKGKDFTMSGVGLKVDINTTEMTLSEHVQTTFKKHDS